MEQLLEKCGLKAKYLEVFQAEGITLERFEKMATMGTTSFTTALLEKCKMSCGDFIDLVTTWERSSQGRQNTNSNSKSPLSVKEFDMYKTPTGSSRGGESEISKKWSMFSVNDADSFNSPLEAPTIASRTNDACT